MFCIYNPYSHDSLFATWCVKKKFPNCDFIGVHQVFQIGESIYNQAITSKIGLCIGVQITQDDITALVKKKVKGLLIIDTANTVTKLVLPDNISILHKENESLCVMTHKNLSETPVPELFRYLQDQELMEHEFLESNYIMSYLDSQPKTFESHECIMAQDPINFFEEGKLLYGLVVAQVNDILYRWSNKPVPFCGWAVPFLNVPNHLHRACVERLGKGYPFIVCYSIMDTTVDVRLYSHDEGLDVEQIVLQYGGFGSHRKAQFFADLDLFSFSGDGQEHLYIKKVTQDMLNILSGYVLPQGARNQTLH